MGPSAVVPGASIHAVDGGSRSTTRLACSIVEIDLATAPAFAAELLSLVEEYDEVVVDLAGVRFIDAAGIRVFTSALSAGADRAVRVVVRNASPQVLRVFAIAGVPGLMVGIGEPTASGTAPNAGAA